MTSEIKLPIVRDQSDAWQREVREALKRLQDALNTLNGGSGSVGPPGPTGPAGPTGPTGPAGPAPSGTGVVNVTAGVLGTPYTDTQLTTHVNTFTSGLKGAVTASGGGTLNYARADGTWAQPPGTFVSIYIGLGFFGDASDGTAVFDGVSTVLGLTPTASAANLFAGVTGAFNYYVFTRDMHFDDLTINASVLIFTNYRVFVRGTMVFNGYLGVPGRHGSPGNPSAAGAAGVPPLGSAGTLGFASSGGTGGAAGAGLPTNGGASVTCPRGFSNTGGTGGVAVTYGNGVAGGAGRGGGGGGGTTGQPGGNGGVLTIAGDTEGSLSNIMQAVTGRYLLNNSRFLGGSGGGGGCSAIGASGAGGGGGSGGGCVVLCAREITGTGVLLAGGGNGGTAYQGAITAGNKVSGGGGGGGGWIIVVIGTGSFPSTHVAGGIGGAAHPTGGGGIGGDGGAGFTRLFKVGA